ncbi:FAD/FMN-containing dehydrogenase [Paraburkholderia sp. BL27I4N3]|uniref:FAD-binding oxidoreductase n=1 Tax=Paraburkholderia sp. BL27I4N3 TaxID=1938805 RepID=UPI000E25B514|nr:FAD-binding oxidoreductase [Paraburkholderia sp. BL27I4N3]REE07497.1 FAD/FMN-containing dehydrogenase [Paraburkholderia sp. BL27I4N3]
MSELLAALRARLGASGVLDGADAQPYEIDWRRLYPGHSLAVLRPANTEEVAAAVQLCAAHGVSIVPQGGNTGMVGGGVPDDSGAQIVLSLARMNRVRDIDTLNFSIVVDAGVTLQAAREAVAKVDCALPLMIGSQGTAQIGGVLSTNAGGNNTIKYGNARSLVMGLEVVLADGRVWHGLRRLRKDNTGYCLSQLFVGAEGTLGIITGACLRLVPRLQTVEVGLVSVESPQSALELLERFQRANGDALQAYEYICGDGLELVLSLIPGTQRALRSAADHYVLIELGTSQPESPLRETLETVLGQAIEDGLVFDAAIAESEGQQAALWRLREEQSEAQARAGASVKNDISVSVSATPQLISEATQVCEALMPGIRVLPFGHLGDGNIHFNLVAPEGMDGPTFLAHSDELMHAVNDVTRRLDGSFSAEHGIGRLKVDMLADWRGGVELDLMHRIKKALDPQGLLNPGKILENE